MQGVICDKLASFAIHLSFQCSAEVRPPAPGSVLPILEQFQERSDEQLAQLHMEDVTVGAQTKQRLLQGIRQLLELVPPMPATKHERLLPVQA